MSNVEIGFEDLDGLRAQINEEHGDWGPQLTVSQDLVDWFADLTEDHQWIHVDVEKAAKGPYGGTIAHGDLLLALMPAVRPEPGFQITGETSRVNYGAESYRFLAPVRVGSTIHARARLVDIRERPQGTLVVQELDLRVLDAPKPSLLYTGMLLYRP
ncbi:MAG: MaoC family dehydratase [Acidimicrobiales bacterium]